MSKRDPNTNFHMTVVDETPWENVFARYYGFKDFEEMKKNSEIDELLRSVRN